MSYNETALILRAEEVETTLKSDKAEYSKYRVSTLKVVLYAASVLFYSIDAYAAFDLDAGIRAATEPVARMINNYYAVGIFITGAFGAVLQQQGDLRDRMLGFGKGALIGGLVVGAVKAGLGV